MTSLGWSHSAQSVSKSNPSSGPHSALRADHAPSAIRPNAHARPYTIESDPRFGASSVNTPLSDATWIDRFARARRALTAPTDRPHGRSNELTHGQGNTCRFSKFVRRPSIRRIWQVASTVTPLHATCTDGEDRRPGVVQRFVRPMMADSPLADLPANLLVVPGAPFGREGLVQQPHFLRSDLRCQQCLMNTIRSAWILGAIRYFEISRLDRKRFALASVSLSSTTASTTYNRAPTRTRIALPRISGWPSTGGVS